MIDNSNSGFASNKHVRIFFHQISLFTILIALICVVSSEIVPAYAVIPAKITGLGATTNSTTQITLDWTADVNASKYMIYQNGTNVVNSTTTSKAITGLTQGTDYSFTVSGVDSADSEGPQSDAVIGTTLPGAPSTLTATKETDALTINLAWTAPTGGTAAITGYKIERSLDNSAWSDLVSDTGTTAVTYANTGLDQGTIYYYRVSAINAGGTGAISNVDSDTTNSAPSQVTGFTATKETDALTINLAWTAPANGGSSITGYKIERSLDNSAWSDLVSDTGTTAVTYANTGLNQGTIYYYRVSAINAIGTGTASSVDSDTTNSAPSAPTLDSLTQETEQITLKWTAGANGGSSITGYRIERESPVNDGFAVIVSDSGLVTSYIDKGLRQGTEYNYRISAINAIGVGSVSNEKFVSTYVYQSAYTPPNPPPKFVKDDSDAAATAFTIDGSIVSLTGQPLVSPISAIIESPTTIRITLYDDKGSNYIAHLGLYLGLENGQTKYDSQSYISWTVNQEPEIFDDAGLFENVNVLTHQSKHTMDFVYEIKFAKTLDTSNIIVQAWDRSNNGQLVVIPDALKVGHEEIPEIEFIPIIPKWVKMSASWWVDGITTDDAFLRTVESVVKSGQIQIPNVTELYESKYIPFYKDIRISPDYVKVSEYGSPEITISGKIQKQYYARGQYITFDISNSDDSFQIRSQVGSDGRFYTILSAKDLKPGLYSVQGNYRQMSEIPEHFFIYESKDELPKYDVSKINEMVPEWVKDQTTLWVSEKITDSEFFEVIEFLISERRISI